MFNSSNEPTVDGRTGGLTASERHDLLTAKRRRVALDVLAERTAEVGLSEVAEEVAAREDGAPEAPKRVAVTLHHTHLPRMDDAGVLEYDPEDRRIEPDASIEALSASDRGHS